MKYINIDVKHEFSSILCGKLDTSDFVHTERCMGIPVMIIVEDGILNIEIKDTKYKVNHGEMIILPPKIPHRGFAGESGTGQIKYFWAHFDFNTDYNISETVKGEFSIPVYFRLNDYSRVHILYNQLLDVHKLTGVKKKYCDFLFTALCFEIAAQFENANVSGNKIVNNAISWIETNICSPISLSDVSLITGYNKQYLSKIFKENTGITVNGFITNKKMSIAKELLSGSDMTIALIADSLGFNDVRYFMRTFKRHEGLTCMQYRNSYSKTYLNKR